MTDFPGARWWRFDFHTHTPASGDFLAGVPEEQRAQVTPETWLLKYMEAGIDCVAVTDHNTGDWIDSLKTANQKLAAERPAGYRPIHIFPGVEISANGGVHLLAIFDPGASSRDVDALLAEVQYSGTRGHSDGVTECSLIQVAEKVAKRGALLIPAHVEQDKGLLRLRQTPPDDSGSRQAALDASTLRQILQHPSVLAMEAVNTAVPRPALYDEVNPRWTEVLGSDCHNSKNAPVPGSRFTWVKMASPSLEGLRLALIDGNDFSVERVEALHSADRNQTPRDWIESIRIEDARYMGRGGAAELRFSPWMNALVGGRGTGKSTVIQFLRAALQRRGELTGLPEESEPRKALDRFWKVHKTRLDEGGLEANTRVSVEVRHEGRPFGIELRSDGTHSVSEIDSEGRLRLAASQEVRDRFRVRIFSQGQVLALADQSNQALLDLVDEAADAGPVKAGIDEETRRFLRLRAQRRELNQKLAGRDRLVALLEDIQRKLAALEEAQHAEVLRIHQRRSRQVREIETQIGAVNELAGELDAMSERMVLPDPAEGLFVAEDPAGHRAHAALARLAGVVNEAATDLKAAAQRLRASGSGLRSETLAVVPGTATIGAAATAARGAYEAVVATLKAQGVADPEAFGRLVQERQRIENELADLEALRVRLAEIERDADASRLSIFEGRRALQARRSQFLQRTLASNPFVRIRLEPYGSDARPADRSLREVLDVLDDRFKADLFDDSSGSPAGTLVEVFRSVETLEFEPRGKQVHERLVSLRARMVDAAGGSASGFGGHFVNFIERAQQRQPEMIDRVMIWAPPDGLAVEYSPRGDGKDYRSIQQGSPGQRAAAMLAFFLAHGDEPIVLDQPEDDLDNHLIYDLIVRQLRESKRTRQVIVVTHNPNVVVNGDAEMVHAFDFGGGQCYVKVLGALQEAPLREEICRVMEGGREAFQRRYRRLGDGGRNAR